MLFLKKHSEEKSDQMSQQNLLSWDTFQSKFLFNLNKINKGKLSVCVREGVCMREREGERAREGVEKLCCLKQ